MFIYVYAQIEDCTAAVSAVVRGGFAALNKSSLIHWKQLVLDTQQLSSALSDEHASSNPQPLR